MGNYKTKDKNELKKFLIEEWNSIPLKLVQNLCKNYLERIKKVFELKGQKLEQEDLRKYKKNREIYTWVVPEDLPKMRVAYNHEIINIIREKEIKELKEEIKNINISFKGKIKLNNKVKKKFKKRDLKNMSIGRALSIINGPQTAENEKKLAISENEKKIDLISKMTLWEYLEHHKEKEKKKKSLLMSKKNQSILIQQWMKLNKNYHI